MESCEDISLRDLFSLYMNTGQAVLVKNITNKASSDSVQCFIEVILKSEMIAMYWPPEAKTCCIAVVDEPVKDLTVYTKILQEKTLEGNIVELCPLGQAEGLFIRRVPENVSNQFLELYFESPRSAGEEDCVSNVKTCDCCKYRMVVIIIRDVSVIKRILEKPSHPNLDKHGLHIDPYFPVIHEISLQKHPKDEPPAVQTLSEDANISTSVKVRVPAVGAESYVPVIGCVGSVDLPKVVKKDSECELPPGNADGLGSAPNATNRTYRQNSQNNKEIPAQKQFSKDVKQMKQVERSRNDIKTYRKHKKATQEELHTNERTPANGEPVALEVTKTNIVLLKINGFTKRCGHCKVQLLEKQGRVQFEGDQDAIKRAKIKMNEILNDVEEITKTLPKHHINYISESAGYIRFQLTKRQIGAIIKTNTDQCTLHSLAFSVQQAQRGLEFVTKELVSKTITIRDGQLQCFQGKEWDNMLHNLQKDVQVTVLEDEKSVDIAAFHGESVENARQKVINYLKQSVPKAKTEVELKGASARCFSHYFLEDLKRKIREQNGELDHKKQDPESLQMVVTGDETLVKLIRDKVKQIWHEKIDFKTITTDVNELWLLMKGLSTRGAKDFLDKFEKEHSCFIDLNKDGEVSLSVVSRLEPELVDTHHSPSPPAERRADFETRSHSLTPYHSPSDDKAEEYKFRLYKNPDAAKRDVQNVIAHFNDLRQRHDDFVFNDGTKKNLLQLDGTIPVSYKGATYNIPICIWLMDTHPYNPPMVFVKPTTTMQIKQGKYVDSNGKIDLPYLKEWRFVKNTLF